MNANEPDSEEGSEEDDVERRNLLARVWSMLSVESEERLEKIPRKDGVEEDEWDPNDIGFFLPSHYYEREDGATFRSLRESEESWNEAVEDMSSTIKQMRSEHPKEYGDLFSGGASRERTSKAIGVFLADLFVEHDSAD